MPDKSTLEQSIEELADETYPATPSGIRHLVCLDPHGWRVYPATFVGPGIPMSVYEGRHLTVCRVPPGAIAVSVRNILMHQLDTLAAVCAEAGQDLSDQDDYLASATHELEQLELDEIVTYWDASDFFEPVEREIIDYAADGLGALDIVDRIGITVDGHRVVDTDQAVERVEEIIAEAVRVGDLELPEPKPCYGCGAPLPSADDVFCGACGGPER